MNIDGKVKICRLPSALREHKFFRSTISNEHLADHCDEEFDSFSDIHGNGTSSQNFRKGTKISSPISHLTLKKDIHLEKI